MRKVAWNAIVKGKKKSSGLGVGSVYLKNKALLFKWLWRLGDCNPEGWQDFISRKYQPSCVNGPDLYFKVPL